SGERGGGTARQRAETTGGGAGEAGEPRTTAEALRAGRASPRERVALLEEGRSDLARGADGPGRRPLRAVPAGPRPDRRTPQGGARRPRSAGPGAARGREVEALGQHERAGGA